MNVSMKEAGLKGKIPAMKQRNFAGAIMNFSPFKRGYCTIADDLWPSKRPMKLPPSYSHTFLTTKQVIKT
jgi:hypothetical protein